MKNPIAKLGRPVAISWFFLSVGGASLAYSGEGQVLIAGKAMLIISAILMLIGICIKEPNKE